MIHLIFGGLTVLPTRDFGGRTLFAVAPEEVGELHDALRASSVDAAGENVVIAGVKLHVSRAVRRKDLAAARTGNLACDEDAAAFGEDIVHDDPILHRVIPCSDEELVGAVVRLHSLFGLQPIGGALHIDVGGAPRPTPSLADLRDLLLKHGFVDLELIGAVARLYGAVEVDEVARDNDGAARYPFAARRCLVMGEDGGRSGCV